jgi:hypothetical protein
MPLGAFTCDTFRSTCRGCGAELHFIRRGRIVLMPHPGHAKGCQALSWQEDVLRTHRVLETINRGYTESELVRQLRGE